MALYNSAEEAAAGIQEVALSIEASLHVLAYRLSDGEPPEGVSAYVIGIPMKHGDTSGMTPVGWAYDEDIARRMAAGVDGVYLEAPKDNRERYGQVISSDPAVYHQIIRDEEAG